MSYFLLGVIVGSVISFFVILKMMSEILKKIFANKEVVDKLKEIVNKI